MAHARIIANRWQGSLTGFGHERIIANRWQGSLTEFSAATTEIVSTLELQNLLNKLGANIVADGYYGKNTRAAIESVASRYNLNYSYSKGTKWPSAKTRPEEGRTQISPSGFMNKLRETVLKETSAAITVEEKIPIKKEPVEPIEIYKKEQEPVILAPMEPPPPAVPAPPVEIEYEERKPIIQERIVEKIIEKPVYIEKKIQVPAVVPEKPEEWYEGELWGVPTMFWIGGSVALSGIMTILALKTKKGKKPPATKPGVGKYR